MYPNMVWQLNQDPYSGHGTASTDWALGTLIHNGGLLFTESLHQPRWLFATECLAAQGFPVVPGMFNFEGDLCKQPLCSFNLPSANRKIRAGCEQAGNSMHVMVMTVLQLHSLVALRYERLPDVIANVALAAKFNRDLKRKRDGVGMDPPRVRFRLRKKTKVWGKCQCFSAAMHWRGCCRCCLWTTCLQKTGEWVAAVAGSLVT